jgi:hypothetical protein
VLKQELGVDSRLEVGKLGQYEVQVDGRTVIRKDGTFPSEAAVLEAVKKALA